MANTGKVRVALIGAGGMANRVHYPSLKECPDVEMAGFCDLAEEKLRKTAERFSISRTFSDYRKMLDDVGPQAVYILMPPPSLRHSYRVPEPETPRVH